MDNPNTILLNKEQKSALETALAGLNLHLGGFAGTGKTFSLKTIIFELQAAGKKVVICAPTARAAQLIGGATLHHTFGLSPEPCVDWENNVIKTFTRKEFSKMDVLVIDEVSMVRMDIMDAVLQSIRNHEMETGHHIQIIVCGDFCQLPPVLKVRNGERGVLKKIYCDNVSKGYAFLSDIWDDCHFVYCCLTQIYRTKDAEYVKNLNLARTGDASCLPYFNKFLKYGDSDNSIVLCGKRARAAEINRQKIERLPGDAVTFNPKVFLNVCPDLSEIPEAVTLKPGCRVIFTKNDSGYESDWVDDPMKLDKKNHKARFSNGSMGIVQEVNCYPDEPEKNNVLVQIDNGPLIYIGYARFKDYMYRYNEESDAFEKVPVCEYSALPMLSGYAITVHKAQGMSFSDVSIDPFCWEPGQFYVLMSRVSDPQKMRLIAPIHKEYLIADPLVIDFYEKSLRGEPINPDREAHRAAAKEAEWVRQHRNKPKQGDGHAGGRPPRFPDGCTPIRVPMEMAEAIEGYLAKAYPVNGTEPRLPYIEAIREVLQTPGGLVNAPKRSGVSGKGRPKRFPTDRKQIKIPNGDVPYVEGFIANAYPEGVFAVDFGLIQTLTTAVNSL